MSEMSDTDRKAHSRRSRTRPFDLLTRRARRHAAQTHHQRHDPREHEDGETLPDRNCGEEEEHRQERKEGKNNPRPKLSEREKEDASEQADIAEVVQMPVPGFGDDRDEAEEGRRGLLRSDGEQDASDSTELIKSSRLRRWRIRREQQERVGEDVNRSTMLSIAG